MQLLVAVQKLFTVQGTTDPSLGATVVESFAYSVHALKSLHFDVAFREKS